MKKILCVVLTLILILSLTGCSEDSSSSTASASSSAETIDDIPEVLNQTEYTLYYNMFSNGEYADYLGAKHEVEGIFTVFYDRYSGVTRYYVWGYMDSTHCCDWQWELDIEDPSDLPTAGSLVTLSGVYEESSDALDGLWLTDLDMTVESVYSGADVALDMTAMSGTLEWVQILNMQYDPDYFEGWSMIAYGRIADIGMLEHPYYDGCWTQGFECSDDSTAIGTSVIVTGSFTDGIVEDAEVTEEFV